MAAKQKLSPRFFFPPRLSFWPRSSYGGELRATNPDRRKLRLCCFHCQFGEVVYRVAH